MSSTQVVALTPQLLIALGAVTAALVAGFFSFLNLIIAKEQKISEFRQGWIDELRKDLSEFISATRLTCNLNHIRYTVRKEKTDDDYASLVSPHISAALRTYAAIFLRINPNDSDPDLREHNKQLLDHLKSIFDAQDEKKYEEAGEMLLKVKDLAQPILKARLR